MTTIVLMLSLMAARYMYAYASGVWQCGRGITFYRLITGCTASDVLTETVLAYLDMAWKNT